MSTLRVRAYNVRFGDAVLLSVPDRHNSRETTRHILIDVGNVLSGRGGDDSVFGPVIKDVLRELDGRPLDLYVMTHEHLDHVQGLMIAKREGFPGLDVDYAWLTASAQEDYYETHEEARRKRIQARDYYREIERYLSLSSDAPSRAVRTMMAVNNPRRTADCVEYLRGLARRTAYIHRESDLANMHPFREATMRVWAPEEDTSVYYGRFQPQALGLAKGQGRQEEGHIETPIPPSGVDAGAFYDLVDIRRHGYGDNLLAIDRAANNSSLVFSLEWRGWKLLFVGDAELRSWKEMEKRNLLEPVHFLKISHHGSHNGTPPSSLLEKILPRVPADARPRRAILSTLPETYNNVPDQPTLDRLGRRCEVFTVQDAPDGGHVDVEFEG